MQTTQTWKQRLDTLRQQHQAEMQLLKAELQESRQAFNQQEQALEELKLTHRAQLEQLQRALDAAAQLQLETVQSARFRFEEAEQRQEAARGHLQVAVDQLFGDLLYQASESFNKRPAIVASYREENGKRLALAEQHPDLLDQLDSYERYRRQLKDYADLLRPSRDDLDEAGCLNLARVFLKPEQLELLGRIEDAGLDQELVLADGTVPLPVAVRQGHVAMADGGQPIREVFLVVPVPEETLEDRAIGLDQRLALCIAEALIELQLLYKDPSLELDAEQYEEHLVYRVQLCTSDTDAEILSYLQDYLNEQLQQQPALQDLEITLQLVPDFAPAILRQLTSWDDMDQIAQSEAMPNKEEPVYASH
ncbi:MAG: hypothetical protein GEEBNDBF_01973 [bacterium]|nr:hypothetical protein [bacterium]